MNVLHDEVCIPSLKTVTSLSEKISHITLHQLFYHEFVQLVLVEGVQLHAAVVEAGVEATEGRENGEAVVLVD